MKISAAIITYNEEKNIERCIHSLQNVVDEIVVVDSFSTDRTEELVKNIGTRFIQHSFETFKQQKNFASSCCEHDWVLSLDADEELSEELKESILEVKENPQADAYALNRLSQFCGHWIHHGGWYPDTKIRLFHKEAGEWGGPNPHEVFQIKSGKKTGHLSGDLLHYTFHTRQQHLDQIEKFTTMSARARFEKGKKAGVFHLTIKPLAKFIRNYLVKGGFRDGSIGLYLARKSAYATWLRYKKLKALHANR